MASTGIRPQPTDRGSGWAPGAGHQRLAVRLLAVPGAGPFLAALKAELAETFLLDVAPESPADVVQQFVDTAAAGGDIESLFDAVHAALIALERTRDSDLPLQREDVPALREIEEAAAAMYCLAACLTVDRAAHRAGEFVIRVPRTEPVICAVIATALFGGELKLMAAEDAELPGVEYVVPVPLPPLGPHAEADFERNAYVALFWGQSRSPEVALDSGPLSEDQREKLVIRLRRIRQREKRSLVFVIRGKIDGEPFHKFAQSYSVPVMVPGDEAAAALFRIPAARLRAHICEFWTSIRVIRGTDIHSVASTPLSTGAETMPSPGTRISIRGGTVAISTGSHAPAQAGMGQSAHVEHHQGTDLAAVISLLQELTREIGSLTSARARETLGEQAVAVEAEIRREKPDPGRIKSLFAAIKSGADVLEDGSRIVDLCHKAYKLAAPLLGLDSSSLP